MRIPAIVLALLLSGIAAAQSVPPRFTMDYEAMAAMIVDRLDLQPGETFLAVAHPGQFDALIPHLRYEVMKAGAIDLGVMDVMAEPVPEAWSSEVLAQGGREAKDALQALLEDIDASIMLPGAVPGQPVYSAIQDNLRAGLGRTIHFHWLGNGSAIPLPGQPPPATHLIEATYQRALLETDYDALATLQRRFEVAMHGSEIRVTSAAGTDIRFRIGDRPVNRQDGNASAARTDDGLVLIDREIELPAGVIRVAPVEESVNGTIAFPPSQWSGSPVTGLVLTIENGIVVDAAADGGVEAVEAEMAAAGPAGRAFREFALGFNPLLAVPETSPWIPYYGYGAGVVRLSLGDNTELGGAVSGGYVRWNFFTDTTVSVDGDVWVENGRLLKR